MKYLNELRKIVDGQILENEPMSKHTTYGIGGPAKVFIKPKDHDDLAKILKFSTCIYVRINRAGLDAI